MVAPVIPPRTVRASSWITDYSSPVRQPRPISPGLSNPLADVLIGGARRGPGRTWRRPPSRSCWPRSAGRSRARSVTVGSTWMWTSTATARSGDRTGVPAVHGTAGPVGDDAAVGRPRSAADRRSRSRPRRTVPGRRPVQLPHGVPRACAGQPATCWRCTPAAAPDGPEVVHLDWWYDTRSFDRMHGRGVGRAVPAGGLIELTSDGVAGGRKSICAGQ